MELVYRDLVTRLKAKVTEIKHIDLENLQLDKPELQDSFDLPAIFIDFEDIEWTNEGRNCQRGNMVINFRIAQKDYRDTSMGDIAPDTIKQATYEAALEALAFNKKVHKALQGYYGVYHNHLQRIRSNQEKRLEDGLVVFNYKYKCLIQDEATDNVGLGGTKTVVPLMDGQIKKEL